MRFRILLGVLLIVAAIGLLLVLVVLPILPGSNDNPAVLSLFASILCEPGERAEIEVVVTRDSDGTGYTPYTTCVGREGERTDASGKHLLIALLAFIVPFMIGLLMLIVNANALNQQARDSWDTGKEVIRVTRDGFSSAGASGSSFSASGFGGSPRIEITDGVLKVDGVNVLDGLTADQRKLLQNMSPLVMHNMQSGDNTLVSKLKEIQEARDASLISADEYDRLRQEILDKLV